MDGVLWLRGTSSTVAGESVPGLDPTSRVVTNAANDPYCLFDVGDIDGDGRVCVAG